MALPCYVSTEWVGLGHATLRFRPRKVQVAESLSQARDSQAAAEDGSTPHPGKTLWWWSPSSWGYGIPWLSRPKNAHQRLLDTHGIECYLSAVYIGEYGERKGKGSTKTTEHQEGVEHHQEGVEEAPSPPGKGQEEDLRPPGVVTEVWTAWLDHWEAWKEVLMPLSWVHKYRDRCTPDYVSWHDSYLNDYPEVLPLITEELGSSELQGDTGKQRPACAATGGKEEPECTLGDVNTTADDDAGKESVNRKVLDDLYTQHSRKRYLVHLRSFLHGSGVECGQDVDAFFQREAGISFNIETTTDEATEGLSQREDVCSSEENCSHGKTELTCNENASPLCDTENEIELQEEPMEDIREASLEDASETSSSSDPPDLSDWLSEGCHGGLQKEDAEPHVSEATEVVVTDNSDLQNEEVVVTDSSGNKEEGIHEGQAGTHDARTSSSHEHRTAKKKRRKKDATARPEGMSWALKHIQKATVRQDEEKIPQPSEMPLSLEAPEAVPETLEASPRTAEADRTTSDADPGTTLEESEGAVAEEEGDLATFLEWMRCIDNRSLALNNSKMEREVLREASQKSPMRLAKLLTLCSAAVSRTAVMLEKVLLPFTALHFFNFGFPGAAVVEYEGSVTEDVPGQRRRLQLRFDTLVFEVKYDLQRNLPRLFKFCLATLKETVMPLAARHLTNLVFLAASEIEHRFPACVFGVQWLSKPDPSLCVEGKSVKRHQRRFHTWLQEHHPNLSPSCTVKLMGLVMHRVNSEPDSRVSHRAYQQVVKEAETETEDGCHRLTLHTLHPLSMPGACGGGSVAGEVEVEWPAMEITFDKDGNFRVGESSTTTEQPQDQDSAEAEVEAWKKIIAGCQRLSYRKGGGSVPSDLPKDIHKYWAQRYRLFLKYDQGIKLDNESWYSVTPEVLAAHQARRCRCEVAVDAMCGAGGNAIQLAKTCGKVIAIDKDPRKVELARHNALVYGVADRIDFRVGDFFKLAPYLKADVVYLSPPWGGVEYLEEAVYNVYRLGGTMNCARLLRAARGITPSVAIYLPRNSDLGQVIALAGVDGSVDIETGYMGPKKKAITAYFGGLAAKGV